MTTSRLLVLSPHAGTLAYLSNHGFPRAGSLYPTAACPFSSSPVLSGPCLALPGSCLVLSCLILSCHFPCCHLLRYLALHCLLLYFIVFHCLASYTCSLVFLILPLAAQLTKHLFTTPSLLLTIIDHQLAVQLHPILTKFRRINIVRIGELSLISKLTIKLFEL